MLAYIVGILWIAGLLEGASGGEPELELCAGFIARTRRIRTAWIGGDGMTPRINPRSKPAHPERLALWQLAIGDVELSGLWIVVDREFRAAE